MRGKVRELRRRERIAPLTEQDIADLMSICDVPNAMEWMAAWHVILEERETSKV